MGLVLDILPVSAAPGPWHLIFDDEFNGSALDTTKWTPGMPLWTPGVPSSGYDGTQVTGPIVVADGLEVYLNTQLVVANGVLTISAIAEQNTDGHGTYDYTSGLISGINPAYPWTGAPLFSFTYGYVEARVWLDGSGGVVNNWPAMSLFSLPWLTTQMNLSGEIDIFEGLHGVAAAGYYNASGYQGAKTGAGQYTGWHTFACDWEPGIITIYYDGVSIGTYTSGVEGVAMFLVMVLQISTLVASPIVVPSSMLVDYVRVWQH